MKIPDEARYLIHTTTTAALREVAKLAVETANLMSEDDKKIPADVTLVGFAEALVSKIKPYRR